MTPIAAVLEAHEAPRRCPRLGSRAAFVATRPMTDFTGPAIHWSRSMIWMGLRHQASAPSSSRVPLHAAEA